MTDTPRTARTVAAQVRGCFARLVQLDAKVREFQSRPPLSLSDQTIAQTSAQLQAEEGFALRQAILALLDSQVYLLEQRADDETKQFRPRVLDGGRPC